MTWHYVKDGEPAGPISDDQLLSLLRFGAIQPTTLVWKTGMAEWQPASSVVSSITPALPVEPMMSPALGVTAASPLEAASGAPPVLPHFFCTFCGTIIPADQLVRIAGRAVCAICKPRYVQQAQEGVFAPVKAPVLGPAVARPPGSDLADPFLRFLAHVFDSVIVMAPMVVAYLAFVFFLGVNMAATRANTDLPPAMVVAMVLFVVLALAWTIFYWTWFIARNGSTPAMRLLNLRMVRADRTPISYSLAFGRFVLFSLLNQCTMGLTNLTALFDRERRTLVDMLCNTRVVVRT